jgi:DnaJ-class molecular chaperone
LQTIIAAVKASIMENLTDKQKIEQQRQQIQLMQADIINRQERKIADLELQIEELECKLQGLIKCIECDGEGGKYKGSTGRLGHPQDPQTWEYCKACGGEGWVKD